MTTVLAEVTGRNTKTGDLWLRVPYKKAHRGILVDDDTLPHGEKSATMIEVRMGEIRPGPNGVWTADVEFVRNASTSDE